MRSLPHDVKLPHMGWNHLQVQRTSRLARRLSPNRDYFYFAHTFAATESAHELVATCEHGTRFAAVIEDNNVFATQFHPEKSGAAGARLLKNFVGVAA